jgi:hypothetical protein
MPIVQLHSKQPGPFKDTQYFEFKDTQYISFYSVGPSLITLNIDPVTLKRGTTLFTDIISYTDSSSTIYFDITGLTGTANIESSIDSTSELIIGITEDLSGTAPIVSKFLCEQLLVDPIIDMTSVNIVAFTDSSATIIFGAPEVLISTSSIVSNIPNSVLTLGLGEGLTGTSNISSSDSTSVLIIGTIEILDSTTYIQLSVTGLLDPINPLTASSDIVSDATATLKIGIDRELYLDVAAYTDSSATIFSSITSLSGSADIQSDTTAALSFEISEILEGTSSIQSVVSQSDLIIGIINPLDGTSSIVFVVDPSELIIGITETLEGTSSIVFNITGDLVLGEDISLDSSASIISVISTSNLDISIPLSGTSVIDSTAVGILYAEGITEVLTSTSSIVSDTTAELTLGIINPLSSTTNIISNIPNTDLIIGIITPLSSTIDIVSDTTASLYIGALAPEELTGTAPIQSNVTGENLIVEIVELSGSTSITSEVDGTLILGAAVDFESGTVYIISSVTSEQLLTQAVNLTGTSSITSLVGDSNLTNIPWPITDVDATCVITTNVQGTTLVFGAPEELSGVANIDPKVDGFIYLGQITPIKGTVNIQSNYSDSSILSNNVVALTSTGLNLGLWVQHFGNTELTIYDYGSWSGTDWDTQYDSTSSEWTIDLHPYTGFKNTKDNRFEDTVSSHWIRNFDALNYRPTKIRVEFDSTSTVNISIQDKNNVWIVSDEVVYSSESVDFTLGSYDLETILITSNDPVTITNIEFFEGVGVPCHIQSAFDALLSNEIVLSGSSDTTSSITGFIIGAVEELDGTSVITTNISGDLGFDFSLSGTSSIVSNTSDSILTTEDEVLSGTTYIQSDTTSAILSVLYTGTASIYSNVEGILSLGAGTALDSSSCLIISNVSGYTLNIDPVIKGRRRTTYDLQYWFSVYVVESELNISQLPFLSTEEVYFRNDSFIELLFNEDYDSEHYRHLYREETERHLWPSTVRDRILIRPASAQYFVACDSTALEGFNLYNLHNDDLLMLDTLLYYRLYPESATLVGIDYEDLGSNISKMIYMYLDLRINDNFSLFDHSEMMSSTTDLLEICYESYLIEQVFSFISQQGT